MSDPGEIDLTTTDAEGELADAANEANTSALEADVLQSQPTRAAAAMSDEARKVVRRIAEQVGVAREDGQTSANILQSLRRDLSAGRGGLEGLLATAREQAEIAQQRYYIAGQEQQLTQGEDPNKVRATWNAVGVRTCADCLARHGLTKTVEEWKRIGRPGQGATRCRHRCRCYLISIQQAMKLYGARSEADLEKQAREPIRERAEAIAKEVKARGREIQRSTFTQKLGDFRQETAVKTLTAESAPK